MANAFKNVTPKFVVGILLGLAALVLVQPTTNGGRGVVVVISILLCYLLWSIMSRLFGGKSHRKRGKR